MTTFVRLAVTTFCAVMARAQQPPLLRVDGLAVPWLERFESAAASVAPMSARTAALVTLGWLRVADHAKARAALANCCAAADLDTGADRVAPAWAAAASLWYLRATRDAATVERHLPRVAAALGGIRGTASRERFADEALLVHGRLCLAAAQSCLDLDTSNDGSPANDGARRAIERWIEVERRAWQPGREHFRPRLTDGSLLLPEPPDESVLWPAAAGMLVATGDRAARHAHTVLRAAFDAMPIEPRDAPFDSPHGAALLLATATQFADSAGRHEAWRRFVQHANGTAVGRDVTALELDSALFAITGVRLATGAGVDEGWLRVRPWLPPDRDHVRIRGLHAEGTAFELHLERRSGELAADERGEDAFECPTGERLHVCIVVAASSPRPARIVLQGPSIQFVTSVEPGGSFARSLPTSVP